MLQETMTHAPAPAPAPACTPDTRVHYLDAARTLAVFAVIVIHAAGGYMYKMGAGKERLDWWIANGAEAFVRWAVPVFIMLTGALLIDPARPFNAGYYIRRRLLKVMLPFLAWSVLYAAWMANNRFFFVIRFSPEYFWQTVAAIPKKHVYSHLLFFYYLIPLYFVVPLLTWWVSRIEQQVILHYIWVWMFLLLLIVLKANARWSGDLFIYSGFMLAGYYLRQNDLFAPWTAGILFLLSCLITAVGTWWMTFPGTSLNGTFLDYKSINVALGAVCLVQLLKYGVRRPYALFSLVSKYSMGIFFVHFMLIYVYMNQLPRVYAMGPLLNVPLMSVSVLVLSLAVTWAMARIPLVRALVP